MDFTTIITSVLTSSVVTGILVFSLKSVIKSKIEHYYKKELEKIKSDLNIHVNQEQVLINRRNEAYPTIVELVYKTRNMAREIVTLMNFKSRTFMDEFALKVHELEESLYKYRIDLERDNCFDETHKYKNSLLNLNMKISDITFFIEHNADDKVISHKKELEEEYKIIDKLYQELIETLSNKK